MKRLIDVGSQDADEYESLAEAEWRRNASMNGHLPSLFLHLVLSVEREVEFQHVDRPRGG